MKRILLIEDDIEIGEVEKAYLEISGFQVVVEKNGLKGKEIALKEPFDMVVLDIMLPGLDGFKIAEAIRNYKDIPIMIVSAKNTEVDKLKGLSLGIDDYLTKPFSPHELVARVKAHLKRYEMLKSGTNGINHKSFELRGILIDFETRQVFVNGEIVELTVKEYDLLALLSSAPNKVFSKDEIFAKVWGYEVEIDTSTLTVHVRKLREKIEFDPSNPEYIQTVWGVGYKPKK